METAARRAPRWQRLGRRLEAGRAALAAVTEVLAGRPAGDPGRQGREARSTSAPSQPSPQLSELRAPIHPPSELGVNNFFTHHPSSAPASPGELAERRGPGTSGPEMWP